MIGEGGDEPTTEKKSKDDFSIKKKALNQLEMDVLGADFTVLHQEDLNFDGIARFKVLKEDQDLEKANRIKTK